MIAVVDYGLGNIHAFANIYKRLQIPVTLAKSVNDLDRATHIVLPGVGAFAWAMERLSASGMRARLDQLVIEDRLPVLGVCVGMQMMAYRSDEGGAMGLGWLDAEVRRFDETRLHGSTHLPHMGWNDVVPVTDVGLFRKIGDGARFYFLHSYYFAPNDSSDILGTTDYGDRFACAVQKGNVYGVQFHPEKSHSWGIQLLRNFAEL